MLLHKWGISPKKITNALIIKAKLGGKYHDT